MAILLIIDDSEAQRAELRALLKPARVFDRVLEAANGMVGLRMLLREPVDVVLCDLELPGLDGEKLLRVQAERAGGGRAPFLFLSGRAGPRQRARLLERGAADVLPKPFHPAELVARLSLQLKVKRLQDELRIKNATLERMSSVDALTGVRSRRYAMELLRVEFLRSRRYGSPLALVMADLDHFKAVNDAHGHPVGDAVLREIGARLQESSRATDVAARYGGEEFLVILPRNDAEGARVMAERWRESVAKQPIQAAEGLVLRLTVSAGVAELDAAMQGPEDLLAAADRALYRAKGAGRNRVALHRP